MLELNSSWRDEFDSYLENLTSGSNDAVQPLLDAIRYSLCSGGKRIRPMLLLSFYAMFKGDYKGAFPFAAALEMIHASSLIHDDMPCMDNDSLRRGQPTLHCAKGESVAMVAGDALLNLAYETMLNASIASDALVAMRTIAASAGVRGVQGGQYLDTELVKKTPEIILQTYLLKTARLIEAACLAGAQLGGASEDEACAAAEYGRKIGIAFQIQDDILDVIGDAKLMGKEPGNDEKCQKTTYVSFFGMEKAEKEVLRLLSEAKEALNIYGQSAESLICFADALVKRKK